MKEFPCVQEIYKGKKCILMKADVFHSFFNEMMKYTNLDNELLKYINNRFTHANKIKKRRRRIKKEKEVLTVMYDILVSEFTKE